MTVKQIAKIPIAGWLIGVVVVLALFVWFLMLKARTLAARLRVESGLRTVRRHHETYIRTQLDANTIAHKKTALQWHKLEQNKLKEIRQLQKETATNKGLSDAFNRVFGR